MPVNNEVCDKILRYLDGQGAYGEKNDYAGHGAPLREWVLSQGWDEKETGLEVKAMIQDGLVVCIEAFRMYCPEEAWITSQGRAYLDPDNPRYRGAVTTRTETLNIGGNVLGPVTTGGGNTVSITTTPQELLNALSRAVDEAPGISDKDRNSLKGAVDGFLKHPASLQVTGWLLKLLGTPE